MFIGLGLFAICIAATVAIVVNSEPTVRTGIAALGFALLGVIFGAGGFYVGPQYTVWQQGMEGRAAFTRAEQDRQIRVEEARAEHEASKLQAQAEVERARGAAEANEIMLKSLGGPDRYLRWRWIVMLENNNKSNIKREIIYVPADGNMPMTEAGRAVAP